MSRFSDAVRAGQVLLMDGAMGTELHRAGLAAGECFELWNLTHPDRVTAIHRAYIRSGARCVLTNTFQANPEALAKRGIRGKLHAIWTAALSLARLAAGCEHFVLADVGPILDMKSSREFKNPGALEELVPELSAADAILFETCSDPNVLLTLRECRRLLDASTPPLLLSLSYRRIGNGMLQTLSGHQPEWFAERASESGAAALGVNCGRDIGIDDMLEILRRYRQVSDLPLFARPNAGTPSQIGERCIYSLTPDSLGHRAREVLEAGCVLIGGCCGTTPEHIAALRPVVEAWNAEH
ncbi:MAG TPA: homocysteine S-methyltransferase family protein [Gemmataceae bacterium]|nr:homocysteine S-methyltransferase family protein [Gemmataceae bacterium]